MVYIIIYEVDYLNFIYFLFFIYYFLYFKFDRKDSNLEQKRLYNCVLSNAIDDEQQEESNKIIIMVITIVFQLIPNCNCSVSG